jgi:TorA maturation chaperone TorD
MHSSVPETSVDTTGRQAMRMPVAQEEQARADLYGLIARLLLAPPDDDLLDSLAGADAIVSSDTAQAIDRAWDQLSLTARLLPFEVVRDEYNDLFISTGVPRVNPYGSLYLAGFLHEKPLAVLRADLAKLGLARRDGTVETEDHLGVLCETMRRLIVDGRSVAAQKKFFDAHLATWQASCLAHLRRAEGAQFYARVADLAAAFFEIEQQAFDVAEDDSAD